jgi:hypothetical protein
MLRKRGSHTLPVSKRENRVREREYPTSLLSVSVAGVIVGVVADDGWLCNDGRSAGGVDGLPTSA